MHRPWKGIRRALGAPISTLLLLLSVAVPVMDAADLATVTVVESRHDPASCAPSHDHTVCTQVGTDPPLATGEGLRAGAAPGSAPAAWEVSVSAAPSGLADGHPTRAPPAV